MLVDCCVLCCRGCGPERPYDSGGRHGPSIVDRIFPSFLSQTQVTSPQNPSSTTKPTTSLTKISPPKIPGRLGSQETELIPITFMTLSTAYFSWLGHVRVLSMNLYHRPGFKRQLMFQDVTAKYCIYDKVPSLPMSFFVRIKGCVNCRTTTSVYKNAY